MSAALLTSLTLYIFVTSITPGPNNLLLASSGLTYGLRRTVPQILGVAIGFITLILVVAFGLGVLIAEEPRVLMALKAIAVAYFLYLTWKLWTSKPPESDEAGNPIRFWQAFAFQFINPKGILMAVTAIAVFAAPGPEFYWAVTIIVLVDLFVGVPCSVAWAAFGATIRNHYKGTNAFALFNKAMAVLTALTVLLIIKD
jgi:threonine/homoserine/homoserine lactone efflux protein